jgi:predicted O-linked N-acetylglucosamine transferase (SPINDLY family)/glycosyltransferase involved in cell wall biosynthesis
VKIAFVDLHRFAYTCDSPYAGPLGGTQSALAYLTAALARRGHRVTVLNAVPEPVSSAGVEFLGRDRLSGAFLNAFDAVVMVSAALGRELREAGVVKPLVLWCHHDIDQPAVDNLRWEDERAAWNAFAMVSRWQAERYATSFGVPPAAQRVLGNAISPAFHEMPEKRCWLERGTAPILYYTSAPFRGLAVLLDTMPVILGALPGTRLRVYSGAELYGTAASRDGYRTLADRCRATEGVEYVGPVSQKAIAAALVAADVHAYPSTFPETSCIAVMESMAAGSLIVSIRVGAIEETAAGFASLMEAPADANSLAQRYAEHLVRTLDEAARDPAALAARLAAQRRFALENYRWERRAEEWESWLASQIVRTKAVVRPMIGGAALSCKAEGNLLKAAGDREGAIARYRRALQAEPEFVPALYNLGAMFHEEGRLGDAESLFRRCLALHPRDRDALFRLGLVLAALDRHREAEEAYRGALELDEANPLLWLELGRTYKTLDRRPEAVSCLRRALEHAPRLDEAHNVLGLVLQEMGQLEEAVRHYGEAATLDPNEAVYFNNLGCALGLIGTLDQAVTMLRRAVELNPDGVEAHRNLAEIYGVQGRRDLSLQSYLAAYERSPADPSIAAGLLFALQHACDWSRLDELCAARRRAVLEGHSAHTDPFTLLSIPSSRAEQLKGARDYAKRISDSVAAHRERLHFAFQRGPRAKLKVGYLSADFQEHATAYLMAELFELHDRRRFEVFAYSYGPDDGSPMRARLVRAFDRFTDIAQLSHAEAASTVYRDGIDILVDLKGYTTYARTQIVALRPAPIQVSFVGYPGTMGGEFIDYLVGDRMVTPREHAADYSEKLVRVWLCFVLL